MKLKHSWLLRSILCAFFILSRASNGGNWFFVQKSPRWRQAQRANEPKRKERHKKLDLQRARTWETKDSGSGPPNEREKVPTEKKFCECCPPCGSLKENAWWSPKRVPLDVTRIQGASGDRCSRVSRSGASQEEESKRLQVLLLNLDYRAFFLLSCCCCCNHDDASSSHLGLATRNLLLSLYRRKWGKCSLHHHSLSSNTAAWIRNCIVPRLPWVGISLISAWKNANERVRDIVCCLKLAQLLAQVSATKSGYWRRNTWGKELQILRPLNQRDTCEL
jgi:hypothetical protein